MKPMGGIFIRPIFRKASTRVIPALIGGVWVTWIGIWNASGQEPAPYQLDAALLCEGVSANSPLNPAVVFSVARGKVYGYSSFKNVLEKMTVFHHWYSRDRLAAKIKLAVHPPNWSTYSNIQLRQSDKGPWRLDILDEKGIVLKTLRFSVTE